MKNIYENFTSAQAIEAVPEVKPLQMRAAFKGESSLELVHLTRTRT
nr:hypothetical protein [Pseudomonas juntendi]